MPSQLAGSLLAKLEEFQHSKVTPGGVISITDRFGTPEIISFGSTSYSGGSAVSPATVYDIASLTKPLVTAAIAMKLVESGKIDLHTKVHELTDTVSIPEQITTTHLLGHSAGYPAHIHFYESLRKLPSRTDFAGELVKMAAETPLVTEPGQQTQYSDLGYIVLGHILEQVSAKPLHLLFNELIATPLKMRNSLFPSKTSYSPTQQIAPTEDCQTRGLLTGEVHDENAHVAGGVAGHAGLFSDATDIDKFARSLCDSLNDRPSLFNSEISKQFASSSAAPNTSWRLGWDTPSEIPGVSHAGDLWPKDGIGHLGFTGTSLWIDPPKGRWVILLTNRVHPTRNNHGIKDLRRFVMDTIASALR